MHTQVVVLGGGPGGYTAAFLAADLGMDVTIVEVDPRLGGTCLLRGCIPSKALLHATQVADEAKRLADWGLTFGEPTVDVDQLRARKNQVIDTLTAGLGQLAKQRKVTVIGARGVFVDSGTLELEDCTAEVCKQTTRLTFDHCILATGSTVAMPGFLDIGSPRIWTSTEALDLQELPKRLLVIGGGYIGLEMGTVYARLGTEVTVVEMLPSLLATADADLRRPLERSLKRLFQDIHLETKVAKVEDIGAAVRVTLEGRTAGEFEFDRVLVSVGRRPASRGFGLENTPAQVDEKGFVRHDAQMRTDDAKIFVIGDVAGEPMLAHKASYDARIAVEVLAGQPAVWDARAIPAVVFTEPELAWVGPTEAEAKAQGLDYGVSEYPWAASGRAQAQDTTAGVTKLIVNRETERVLGVGICGYNAGELIAEAALAVEMGATAGDLAETIHAHPTLAETTTFAAEAFFGTATEVYRPKKT